MVEQAKLNRAFFDRNGKPSQAEQSFFSQKLKPKPSTAEPISGSDPTLVSRCISDEKFSFQAPWISAMAYRKLDVMPVPPEVVKSIMALFEKYYNFNHADLVSELYSDDCYVTVNGGVEYGGSFTGKNSKEVEGFLDNFRNKLGGTNMNITVTKVNMMTVMTS